MTGKVKRILKWIIKHKLISLIVVAGFITHLSITIFNGSEVCVQSVCGMYIGGLHFHDALWHLSLANFAFNSFPFKLPIYSGATLFGYNFLFDLVLYIFTLFRISSISAYFRFIPFMTLSALVYMSFLVLKKEKNDGKYIASGLFFILFGSAFTYILSFYHYKTWKSFMYAQAMQSGRMFLNMSYAVSLPLLLVSILLLQKKQKNTGDRLLLVLMLFLMFSLKFYGGAILLCLILVDVLYDLFKTRHIFPISLYLVGIVCSVILSYVLFYKSPYQGEGFPFGFAPFSIAHPIIEEKDMFYMPSLVLARYYLVQHNIFSPRLFLIECFSAFLFLVLNMGTRTIGFIYLVWAVVKRKITRMDVFLFLGFFFSTCATLLFVQKREWWNIIQFLGYGLFFLNFFAAKTISEVIIRLNKAIAVVFITIIVLFTLPTNIEQITYAIEKYVSFSQNELHALAFLQKQPTGIVLALPYQETAYVSVFSKKQQYLADKSVLYLIGVPYEKRYAEVKDINKLSFDQTKVDYIYLKKDKDKVPVSLTFSGFDQIYSNNDVVIYKKLK